MVSDNEDADDAAPEASVKDKEQGAGGTKTTADTDAPGAGEQEEEDEGPLEQPGTDQFLENE